MKSSKIQNTRTDCGDAAEDAPEQQQRQAAVQHDEGREAVRPAENEAHPLPATESPNVIHISPLRWRKSGPRALPDALLVCPLAHIGCRHAAGREAKDEERRYCPICELV